ncbi:MAG: pyridoxamine 5'-phosphate oxidase family protein [Candidatus Thorarchaeota archaeon]|jgi:general stress protein 26
MDDNEHREMCLHLLETGWPAYLTTVDDDGYPQTRAMFNLRNKERFPKLVPLFDQHRDDFLIIFTTNTSSTKIEDIKSRLKTSVYYCNPEEWKGVMFGGNIEIVKDVDLKKALWHDGWENYYPKGYDDPDHTVLRIIPTIARGWTGSSTFKLELGDSK